MDCVNRRMPNVYRRSDFMHLFTFADLHEGARATSRDCRKDAITGVKREKGWWMGGGDFGDGILVGDKRFDMRLEKQLDPRLWHRAHRDIGQYQLECQLELLDDFWPIHDKCLGLMVGNHEEAMAQRGQLEFLEGLVKLYQRKCRDCGVTPNPWFTVLGYNVVMLLYFKGSGSHKAAEVMIFATHGTGASATAGGRLNKIEGVLPWLPGCCLYLCFHFHDHIPHPRSVFDIVRGPRPYIQQRKAMILVAPSMLRTYAPGQENYASKRLYPPSVLGVGDIRIWPFGERMRQDRRDFTRPRIEVTV